MKLVINKGERVEDAINYISKFLRENYSSYPVIKNRLNMYITLKSDDGQICPDNEKEFILDNYNIEDVAEYKKEKALQEILLRWDSFVNHCNYMLGVKENNVTKNKKYLETAEAKGRKESNIKNRKLLLEENIKAFNRWTEIFNMVSFFNNNIENVKKYYVQYGEIYKYSYRVYLVFKDEQGNDYFFNGDTLSKGLPPEWSK